MKKYFKYENKNIALHDEKALVALLGVPQCNKSYNVAYNIMRKVIFYAGARKPCLHTELAETCTCLLRSSCIISVLF